MATADSVKAKLQGLIAKANEATGNTDADLTTAVDALVAGFGQGGGDTSIEDSLIDRTITSFRNDRITMVGTNAFYTCDKLTEVYCPNVTEIQGNAFQRCNSLTEITDKNFPKLELIGGDYSFGNCNNLVYFQSSTWTRRTSGRTFQTSALQKLDLSALTIFSANLCLNCGSLETVILRKIDAITTLAATNALSGTKIANGTGYIYVPSALIEEYKAATNWSNYANQFRAIEDYPEICGVSV